MMGVNRLIAVNEWLNMLFQRYIPEISSLWAGGIRCGKCLVCAV
jgi:hypothetical protein